MSFSGNSNNKIFADLSAKIQENKVYIDRLEAILKDNHIPMPERERFSQIRNAEELIGKRLLKDGSREEIQALLARMKKLYRAVHVTVKFKNLDFWTMAPKPKIPTVATTLYDMFFGSHAPKYRIDILKNLNGQFKPFKMTLVLGPPGSGRSVLMKAMSGRLRPRAAKLEGDVYFNDDHVQSGKFIVAKVADYIEQSDTHAPTLTVEETLKYAWQSTTGGHHSYGVASDFVSAQELNEDDEHFTTVRNTITSLGLNGCKDTYVGDQDIRGVSGGQIRRVTAGEMMVLPRPVKFMDDVSNGLDSATTFDIIRSFSETCHTLGTTYVISLLQPSPEVYNLFDEILLLSEGQIVYQGPREEILPYFEELGYFCPEHVDEADFLQVLPTDEGRRYIVPKEGSVVPSGSEQLAQAWKNSNIYKSMIKDMESSQETSDLEAGTKQEKKFHWSQEFKEQFASSFLYHFLLTLHRQYLITIRDTSFISARVGQNIITGIITGSLFSNIAITDVNSMRGLIFQSMLSGTLNSFPMLPLVYKQKEVFNKQADSLLFPISTFTVAQSLILLPLQMIEAIVFSLIVYWSAGLSQDFNGSRFLFFTLMQFVVAATSTQLFRLISFIMPEFDAANPVAGISIILMILFSGYIQPKNQINDGWIGFYWVNPLSWGVQAATINEYKAPKYDFMQCLNADCSESIRYGDYILTEYGNQTDQKYIWYAIGVGLAEYLLFLVLSTLVLNYYRTEPPPRMVIAVEDKVDAKNGQIVTIDSEANHKIGSVELPFEPVTFAFKDIKYTVTLPSGEDIDLLEGVSGFVEPGNITALMGSSGAGKTTLLDVLAGRKNQGVIEGSIYVNGVPKNESHFRRIMGYVEQFDSLSERATARENIQFSAVLRLAANITEEQREQWVDSVLEMLELAPLANTLVGTIDTGGMSFEQRKRVSIGIELAANPTILFLDEPTTGLDSRAAQVVIRNIRKIAASGRTVICTIHQPSTPIFFSFDSLLLLRKGGQTVYFGELGQDSQNLIDFMEQVPNVPRIGHHQNPAVWMLEVIGAGTAAATVDTDFHDYYNKSILREENTKHLNSLIKDPNDPEYQSTRDSMKKNEMPKGYNTSFTTQSYWLSKRTFTTYWRSPKYNVDRFFVNIIVALIFASAYPNMKYHDNMQVISLGAVMYITCFFCGILQMFFVVPIVFSERTVLYREQESNMYSTGLYSAILFLAEVPYIIVSSLLFVIPFFYIIGFNAPGNETQKFLWYWLFQFLYNTLMNSLGQFYAALLPTDQASQVMGGLTATTVTIFAGFLITEKNFTKFWLFMYWLNPLHYALEGLFSTQFHDNDRLIHVNDETMTAEKFINTFYETWHYKHVGYDILALILMTLLIRVGVYVCLKNIRHQQR